MAVNPCLVHSQRWRSDFQCVLNSMQKKDTLMIPVKYVKRIGRHICTCDQEDDFMDDVDDVMKEISQEAATEVNELKTFFNSTNLSTDDKTKLGKAQPILTRLATDLSPEATGKVLFLNIIRDALVGKYGRLELEVESTGKDMKENDRDRVQWEEDVLTLPLAVGCVGHLFGKDGHRIKKIAETYKCQIHVKSVDRKHSDNFDFCAKEISVTLRWKEADSDKIPLLKEHLQSVVKSIIVKRKKHDQAMKDYAEQRRKRVTKPSLFSGAGFKICGPVDTNFKAISKKQFERHHTSRARSSKKRHTGSETHVLDGGYCYFCNGPYWRKKRISCSAASDCDEEDGDMEEAETEEDEDMEEAETEEDEDMEEAETEDVPSPLAENACRYHSGYLIVSPDCPIKKSDKMRSHTWTCCSEVLLGLINDETKRQSHASSGCKRGRHLWRPPNKKTVMDHCASKLQSTRETFGEDDIFLK